MFLSSYFPKTWQTFIGDELLKTYFLNLENFLQNEKKNMYPEPQFIFKALSVTEPKKIKVVILGQDPYHGNGQAEGLSFSVPNQIKRPPSLQNIFKELSSDLNVSIKNLKNNSLLPWAKQGVFLLNSVLTVKKSCPASHAGKGWEIFTEALISRLNTKCDNLVFILWGNYAKKKLNCIDKNKHLVLSSAHPSPFSAHKGFFGSKVFSKTNTYLIKKNKNPIDWLKDQADLKE